MSIYAANPAGPPPVYPCAVEGANKSSLTRNYGGVFRPSCGGHSCSSRTAIAVNFPSQCADENFALASVCPYVSRLLLGHSFGAFPAPGGTRSSASHPAPLRCLGSSRNKFENHGNPVHLDNYIFGSSGKFSLSRHLHVRITDRGSRGS
jgi:hypothetical protein